MMFNILMLLLQMTLQIIFNVVSLSCKVLYRLAVLLVNAYRDRPQLIQNQILVPGDNRPRLPSRGDIHDYRGLATTDELSSLKQGGISLGRYQPPGGRPQGQLYLPTQFLYQHAVVVGPTGSGKTAGIINPWAMNLLGGGNSVVMVDIKGDLMRSLGKRALHQGYKVLYWDISRPNQSLAWNWLDGVKDYRDIEAAIVSIMGRENTNDSHLFFTKRDRRWLRALINVVKSVYAEHAKPRDLYRLIASPEHLKGLFDHYPELVNYQDDLRDLLDFSPDEQSRAVSGLLNELHLFTVPSIEQSTGHSDFCLADLDVQPTLLVIGASLADAKAAETFSGLMLSQLFNHVYRRLEHSGQDSQRSIYFLIDEAARLKTRIDYEQVLSIARAAKVGVCLALQDVSQLGDERAASTVLSNCHTFVTLRGVSAATARYTTSRLGQRVVQTVNLNHHRGPMEAIGSRGKSIGTETVPVLGEREIMHPPFQSYCALVHMPFICSKPFFVDLTQTDLS
ncbi:MAG: type IV secretory system conjugative DNA transfer family protein [Leptolyngbyaceae cyanobacterium]